MTESVFPSADNAIPFSSKNVCITDGIVFIVSPAFPVTRKTPSFETATGSLSRNSIILLYSLAEMIAARDFPDLLYHKSKAAS